MAAVAIWDFSKCIGDDIKAAARQSPNFIKNKKNNNKWRKMNIINIGKEFLHPAMWHVTVNSPSGTGSTLQFNTWLWDDMPLNSPKCPPYWNSTPGFDLDHITAVDMSFCTSLRHFIQIGPHSAKNDDISIFRMANMSHLGFQGSNNRFFRKPNYNLLNYLVFQKIAFLHFGINIQDGGSQPSWIL